MTFLCFKGQMCKISHWVKRIQLYLHTKHSSVQFQYLLPRLSLYGRTQISTFFTAYIFGSYSVQKFTKFCTHPHILINIIHLYIAWNFVVGELGISPFRCKFPQHYPYVIYFGNSPKRIYPSYLYLIDIFLLRYVYSTLLCQLLHSA